MKAKNMRLENFVLIIVLFVLLILFISGVFSMFGNYGSYGMMGMMGFGTMWIFGWLFMSLIIIVLVLFIAWLIKEIQKK